MLMVFSFHQAFPTPTILLKLNDLHGIGPLYIVWSDIWLQNGNWFTGIQRGQGQLKESWRITVFHESWL